MAVKKAAAKKRGRPKKEEQGEITQEQAAYEVLKDNPEMPGKEVVAEVFKRHKLTIGESVVSQARKKLGVKRAKKATGSAPRFQITRVETLIKHAGGLANARAFLETLKGYSTIAEVRHDLDEIEQLLELAKSLAGDEAA